MFESIRRSLAALAVGVTTTGGALDEAAISESLDSQTSIHV